MKTIVITGASDGIGRAAAHQLHADGHTIVLVGRNPDKTKAVSKELGGAPYYVADFSKLGDVRKLAKALSKSYPVIDVLALNAGGIFADRAVTEDGFERTFQVNHLAHFTLVGLLMDTLVKSRASVIATSSAANWLNRLDLDDLNAEKGYSKWTVYGNAKLMNILFTRELVRRYGKKGISAAAFHPGVVATSFSRELSPPLKAVFSSPVSRLFGLKSPQDGADTLIWLAEGTPGTDWKPAEYYANRTVKKASPKAYKVFLANDLWNKSEDMAGSGLRY